MDAFTTPAAIASLVRFAPALAPATSEAS